MLIYDSEYLAECYAGPWTSMTGLPLRLSVTPVHRGNPKLPFSTCPPANASYRRKPESRSVGRSQVTAELLRDSRALLDKAPSAAPGLWERAAVLLARQALEETLDGFWSNRSPDLLQASMRAQLLCLGALMNNERDAADVDQLWGALSDVLSLRCLCLPTPGAAEVRVWLERDRASMRQFLSTAPGANQPERTRSPNAAPSTCPHRSVVSRVIRGRRCAGLRRAQCTVLRVRPGSQAPRPRPAAAYRL